MSVIGEKSFDFNSLDFKKIFPPITRKDCPLPRHLMKLLVLSDGTPTPSLPFQCGIVKLISALMPLVTTGTLIGEKMYGPKKTLL